MKYIIYKIQIKDYIYIGSTQNFTIRKSQHKTCCNNGNDTLVYRTIREHGGWDCCSMVPVKEIEVESKTQARIAEEAVRVEYNAQMNINRAYVSEEDKKEHKAIRFEIWSKNNREYINEKHICECDGKYTTCSKSRHEKSKKHLAFLDTQKSQDNIKPCR